MRLKVVKMRRGQTTIEYAFLIGIAAAAIIAMLVYMSRSFQGNFRGLADQIGAVQYEPGNTTINDSEAMNTQTVSVVSSSSTTYFNEAVTNIEQATANDIINITSNSSETENSTQITENMADERMEKLKGF